MNQTFTLNPSPFPFPLLERGKREMVDDPFSGKGGKGWERVGKGGKGWESDHALSASCQSKDAIPADPSSDSR